MATPRRPRFSPSSSGRQGGGNRLSQAQTAQSLLLAQQEAITALLTRGPAGRKAPTTAGRDDCEVDMSTSDFRSWRRSMEDWITLNSVKDEDAVCYIRLLCVPALQKALDARFPRARWSALDGLGKLVLRASSQTVRWCEFFSAGQTTGECVSDYFTRCAQMVLDCVFQCPGAVYTENLKAKIFS